MPITISKDSNGKIIKRNVPFSTNPPVVYNAPSLGSVDINYNGSINSLKLNNVQVTSTGSQLNYANVTPGTASASKAIVLDSNSSISNLNSVSCTTSITINGNVVTGTNLSGGSTEYLTDITPGSAVASKIAVLDSNSNISGINSISTNTLTLGNCKLTTNNKKMSSISNHTIENISNDNQWNSICWSPTVNLFVAVASTGTGNRVMTSSDGNTWITRTSPADNNWTSVCWSNDLSMFVAVASSGTGDRVMTSPDGITWALRTSATDNDWTSVCWASEISLFVAVASSGTSNQIMTSPDGIEWTSRSAPNVNTWTSVCWSSTLGLLVAVASGGTISNQIMTSANGIDWVVRTSPAANSWTSVCWGSTAGVFVAVSNTGTRNRSMASLDGVIWYSYTTLIDNDWNNIIYSQELNVFIAVASAGVSGKIAYSINGNQWSFINTTIDNGLGCISWSPSLNVFTVLSLQLSSLVNKNVVLNNWDLVFSNFIAGSTARFVTWISELNLFLYSGTNRLLMTSPDGINWTLRTTASTNWNSITYSPSLGMLVAVSNNNDINNAITTSTDSGVTWTSRIAPFGYNWTSICWSSSLSLFVAVSSSSSTNGTVMTSANGINWTARTATTSEWRQIKWVDSLSIFVVVSSSSPYIMTSADGINWTNRTPSTNTTWRSIDWSPTLNLFVAVADTGSTRVMTSPNGINWTNRTSQVTSQWWNVCWCSNLNIFVVVSFNTSSNSIMYSSDAINWTTSLSNNNYSWVSVCYSPSLNKIVAVAESYYIHIMKTDSYYNCFIKSTSLQNSKIDLNDIIDSKYPTIGKIKNVLSNINKYTTSLNYAWSYVTVIPYKTTNPSWSTAKYYIAASTNGIAYSVDGLSWSLINAINGHKSIAFSSSLNLGVTVGPGTGNKIGYFGASNNIASYTQVTTTTNNWTSVCWSTELSMFVAVASSGTDNRVITSLDGINWTSRTSASDNNWASICWSSELMLFVAVASSGTGNRVMTSSNGINWTSRTSAADNNWTSVCWSSELMLFAAVASSGTGNRIMTSTNGITWALQTSPEDNNWNQIIWIPDLYMFAACSSTGTNRFMYSLNGINWNTITLPVNNSFTTLCWNTTINRIVIMSSDGTYNILKSNVFNLTNYNSIIGNYWKINSNTSNVSLATNNNNPEYKFEYSSGVNESQTDSLRLYSQDASNVFSINANFEGTLSFTSTNPSLNIVNHNGSTSGLALNGTLVTATASNLNSIYNITLGKSAALKVMTTDSKKNIYGVNNISCDILNIPDVYSLINPGTVTPNLPALTDSNNNIYSFNRFSSNSLTVSNKTISTYSSKLINNALNASIINYTTASDLGASSGSNENKTLLWVPELNKAVSVRNGTDFGNTISTSVDGIKWTSVTGIQVGSKCSNLIWSPVLKLCIAIFAPTWIHKTSISYDLENWTILSSPTIPGNVNFLAACWSSFTNLFVMFANDRSGDSIFTSSDGINWSAIAGPNTTFYSCISVPSPINLILTIGSNSTLYYSSNGTNWTTKALSGFSGNWYFAYSPSLQKIVAVTNGSVAQSSDGINWTKNSCPNSDWCAIEWAEELGLFIAVSQSVTATDSIIMISKNGVNWYLRSNYTAITGQFNSPILTNVKWAASLNRFLFCTKSNLTDGGINNNPANMMGYSNANAFSNFDYSIADISNNINIPSLNRIIKNPKGIIYNALNTWHSRSSTADINWTSVCYSVVSNVITFVAVASGGSENGVMTSPEGKNWTSQIPASDNDWTSVCWSPELSLFAAVASSGTGDRVMTSPDGITWTSQTSVVDNNWTFICWSSELDLFVAVASSGTGDRVMTSPDGITWTSRTSAADNNWTSICWSKELNLFVAVASSGTGNRVMSSSDGINWTSRTSAADNNWTSVCWSSDRLLFIAVASSGTSNRVMTSLDGINWNIQYTANDYNWVSICWIVELNCAIAISTKTTIYNQNAIMISYDCYNWQILSYTNANTWTSFVWSPDYAMFVAVSNTGTGDRVINSTMAFSTYKNSVIASSKFITILDSSIYYVGLGRSPSYQLHLSTDSAAKPATSTWTVSSDERLKENIQDADIDQCYNDVNNLRLTKYTWKDDVYTIDEVPDRSKLGWIAQEVEQIYPKAVEKHNMHGYEDCRTLNNDQIIASLYGCIQKLIQKCETRQTTIDTLISKYNEIKSVLDSLEIVNE